MKFTSTSVSWTRKAAAHRASQILRRDQELTASEDITPLLTKLEELAERFLETRDRLEYEKVELADGEERYQFYRQVSSKLNDIRRRLK